MGIKGLWSLLSPFCEKKSLYEIRGQTLAIDLSGWVCDSQNVTEYHVQPKLYLRNLFFRTSYLLLSEVRPIFVLEGEAPVLKQDVMAARNAIQFKGAAPRKDSTSAARPNTNRKRFMVVLRECENLLKSMGVQCIKGKGEAEAMCAHLNMLGVVDAVVSQDSDCFAYGAIRVYRNFSVVGSAGGGAQQGSIDCYEIDTIKKEKDFGRNKMVCLALLCGCDYSPGAVGSSITTALAFLETVTEKDSLNRLLSWVSDSEAYDRKRRAIETPGLCGTCGHAGKQHSKNGCCVCNTNRGCTDNGYKAKKSEISRELQLRKRALSFERPFPDPLVMKEFLQKPEEAPDLVKPLAPSLVAFIKIMMNKLEWTERYCVEKFLPLLTKWHLQEEVPNRTIKPKFIKKKRNPRGVPSYEVIWEDVNGHYAGLVPDDQLSEGESIEAIWTTIERQDLMKKYYPSLVEAYEISIQKPPKEKSRRKVKEKVPKKAKLKPLMNDEIQLLNDFDHLSDSMKKLQIHNNLETTRNKTVLNLKKSKRDIKKRRVQKKMDNFVSKKLKLSESKEIINLLNSFKHIALETHTDENNKPNNVTNTSANKDIIDQTILNNLSEDVFSDEDLSLIIDQIITRNQKEIKNASLKKLSYKDCLHKKFIDKLTDCSTPNQSPKRYSNKSQHSIEKSFFFDKLTEECDAFEQSLGMWKGSFVYDIDNTLEYSFIN